MASTSPVPGLSVKPVHNKEFASFGSESAFESATSPRIQGVQYNAAVSVWMESDEEGVLATCEFAMVIVVFMTWYCVSLCALCRRLRASAGL